MADTTFGWDTSSYDDPPTARDGIDFATHKLTDGDHYYEDPEYRAAITAFRDLGVPILGAYHVLHGQRSITSQAAWMVARADALTPWWRDWPNWFWQLDAEPFAYLTRPTIGECNAWCAEMTRLTGRPAWGYLPAWSYGAQVQQLAVPWWQSSYVNGSGPYRALYPGNGSPLWVGGGRHADMLQYTSSAVIAGQTTSDANAFAGTLAQLLAAIGGAPTERGTDMSTLWDVLSVTPIAADGTGGIEWGGKQYPAGTEWWCDGAHYWPAGVLAPRGDEAYIYVGRWGETHPDATNPSWDGPLKRDLRGKGSNPNVPGSGTSPFGSYVTPYDPASGVTLELFIGMGAQPLQQPAAAPIPPTPPDPTPPSTVTLQAGQSVTVIAAGAGG